MKKSKNVRKLNNQGMSLIEILVAMIILGVVTASLLHSFVTSVRLNAKAKEKQRVATAAQSLMEGLKAYDMEHICLQFNGGDRYPMHLIGNVESYKEVAPSGSSDDWGVSIVLDDDGYTFSPAADGRYAFVLRGITFEDMTGEERYDALISITPNKVWNDDLFEDGSAGLIDVVDINAYLDAVYMQTNSNMDQTVYAQIMQDILNELNDAEDAGDGEEGDGSGEGEEDEEDDGLYDLHDLEEMGHLSVIKTTTVTITEESDPALLTKKSNKVIVEIKYVYDYTLNGDSESYKNGEKYIGYNEDKQMQISDLQIENLIYNSENTGVNLENVYLFYYPAYQNGMNLNEEIILRNGTSSNQNIYLIKQLNAGLSRGNLILCENNYGVEVTVEKVGLYTGKINLYHNLSDNLANRGETLANEHLIHIKDDNGLLEEKKSETVTSADKFLLYNVTISIYESGAADPEDGPFPDEMWILDLNGTMND